MGQQVGNGEENKTIDVLVYGLGAIGSFYAFILQKSQRVRLSVVARSNYDAVRRNGLHIKSENHGDHVFHPAAVLKSPAEAIGDEDFKTDHSGNTGGGDDGDAGEGTEVRRSKTKTFDFIVCANKAIDLRHTAQDLVPVVDPQRTTIVVMQNGVGNEDFFVDLFPSCTILSGVIWVGATQDSPGVVRQHLSESTTIGIFSNPSIPAVKQQRSLDLFTSLFSEGGTPFIIDPEIQTPRWKKCIWNAAWNSLATLTGVDIHNWLGSSEFAMETTRRLMREAIHVARMAGVPGIDESLVDELITRMQGLKGVVWTSMYHDCQAGRAMEVDVIIGTMVKKGKALGVDVPTLETLYAMLLAVSQRNERAKAERTN